MKFIFWIVGGVVALALALGILQYVASERVEVIELHTQDQTGDMVTTRLWVVDYEGVPYLRGESESGWFQRLQSEELVEITRNGETRTYRHQIQNQHIDNINQLMRDKYTWGDEIIAFMLGSREQSNAVRLTLDES